MDVLSTLWFMVSGGALVLAGDATVRLVRNRPPAVPGAQRQVAWFAVLMLALACGCAGVGLYEALN